MGLRVQLRVVVVARVAGGGRGPDARLVTRAGGVGVGDPGDVLVLARALGTSGLDHSVGEQGWVDPGGSSGPLESCHT